ncbi:MAG: S8 family serine peptidase [Planctomycetota bacterium]
MGIASLIGLCAHSLASVGALAGPPQTGLVPSQPLDIQITAADAQAGTVSRVLVVRQAASDPGDDRSKAEAAVQRRLASYGDAVRRGSAASATRSPGSFAFGGVRYDVVQVVGPALAGAIAADLSAEPGVSVSPLLVGRSQHEPAVPNDPFFGVQYAFENSGQTIDGVAGREGADIGLLAGWGMQLGSPDVRIAVIDAGVAASHPDLRDKLDPGFSVVGDPSLTDAQLNSHGTHIAGIVGAKSNNSEGVVGVSWGSRIVPVKAANDLGFTSDAWLAEGLVWAVDAGVDIAVMSFGLSQRSDVLADAVAYAAEQGVLVVASAGNSGQDGVLYPAAYPGAVAVGATTNADTLASFSNRGPEIDFVAPGVDIYSTWHTAFQPNTYTYESGTSVSAPLVAGAAALLLSADPTLTVDEIRSVLARTSTDLGPMGRDTAFGNGRINADRALAEVLGLPWCYADIDGNREVAPNDFTAWIFAYGSGEARADQNRDGLVTPADFSSFLLNYSRQRGPCD